MKTFDVLVAGSGSGLDAAAFAHRRGLTVAIVEEGPLGGTCLNRGCIPSKMLIHSADVMETIKNSGKFGIKSRVEAIDFASIVKRVSDIVDEDSAGIEAAWQSLPRAQLYKARGKFVDKKVMEVAGERITADKVFIVGGTRPSIPPIPGLDEVPYLTSTEALRLSRLPEHLVIVGGGYIAVELGHFFGALGSKVTVIEREQLLVNDEDAEIAEHFTQEFSKKYTVKVKTEVEQFQKQGSKVAVTLKGSKKPLTASHVLIATGRQPNTDILGIAATGVDTDDKGYIKVNAKLETNVPGIWAWGDIAGILPLKHTANHQTGYAIRNAFLGKKETVDYHAIPHAVFSSPQVAGVGKTEEELKKEGIHYHVGKYEYKDTAMGEALRENGLVKVLVGEDDTILGCYIVGPSASTLIHEVVVAMKTTGKVSAITDSVYAHPALSEVVQRAFYRV